MLIFIPVINLLLFLSQSESSILLFLDLGDQTESCNILNKNLRTILVHII